MNWTEEKKQKVRFGLILAIAVLCLYWALGSIWLVLRSLQGIPATEIHLDAMGMLSAVLCVFLAISIRFGAIWAAVIPLAGAALCGIFSLLQWRKRPVAYCQFTMVLSLVTVLLTMLSWWLSGLF